MNSFLVKKIGINPTKLEFFLQPEKNINYFWRYFLNNLFFVKKFRTKRGFFENFFLKFQY